VKILHNVLRTVCIEPNLSLLGNEETNSFQPHIIIYDDDSVDLVLERFVELIKELKVDNIHKKTKRPIKAIGWVGPNPDKPEKHTIKTYFEGYYRPTTQQRRLLPSLKSYMKKNESKKAKGYSDSIIDCFLRVLSLSDKKRETENGARPFTKNTLLNTLKVKDEEFYEVFRIKIATWINGIINSGEDYSSVVLSSIKSYILQKFLPFFEIELSYDLKEFINSELLDGGSDDEVPISQNIYRHPGPEYSGIEVKVGTIHSAKGETHTATLYMETEYQGKRESETILDQLKGEPYKQPRSKKDTYKKETLKMAYVGMSRPSHLLCFAGKKENMLPLRDELEDNGWVIIDNLVR